MDERLIVATTIRAVLLVLAVVNVRLARRERLHYRDARGLRGFIGSLTMLGGTVAFSASSPAITTALGSPLILPVLTGAGVFVFLAGLIFSVVSWRVGR